MLVKAIHFHESRLGSKVFRSIRLFKKKFKVLNKAEKAV